jgi:TAG lipase/steryl ester hydrolase/phospholipase A2/LPA acyltransferase
VIPNIFASVAEAFQEAFNRTGRILNITVSPTNRSDPPRLLNYLTAPHVLVWSAAVASSSLPGVFEANRLLVKDADGSERYESNTSVRFAMEA